MSVIKEKRKEIQCQDQNHVHKKGIFHRMGNRMCSLIKDRSGNMIPLVVAVALAILFIILGVSEYMRIMITVAGIKDATESAVISVINDNYAEVYHGVREGYAAGYESEEEGFVSSVDYGDVYGRLCYLLGMEEDGSGYVRINNGGEREYRVSELSVTIPNTALASLGGTYYAQTTLKVEVPVRFGGRIVSNLTINLNVKAAYREKF